MNIFFSGTRSAGLSDTFPVKIAPSSRNQPPAARIPEKTTRNARPRFTSHILGIMTSGHPVFSPDFFMYPATMMSAWTWSPPFPMAPICTRSKTRILGEDSMP